MRRILGSLFVLAAFAGPAFAQTLFPSRIVKIVVPNPPGGVTDILARVIGQSLQQNWGQSVIIENRPGADDMLGTDAVAKSPPDGHTLLVTSNGAITAAPHIHKEMRYNPLKDLTPLLILGQATPMMNVPAASPVKNVQELIALAKARPDVLNYGSFGNGTYAHVAMEDFKQRTGAAIVHVPYRGSTPAIQALLQNEIAVLIVNLSNVAEHASAGTVRILASAGAKRATTRPDLPTVAESGVPGFSTGAWWGLFGPANLPAEVVVKIRADVTRALATPEARKFYDANTFEPLTKTPAEFAQFIRDDLDNWGRQIKAAGIKTE